MCEPIQFNFLQTIHPRYWHIQMDRTSSRGSRQVRRDGTLHSLTLQQKLNAFRKNVVNAVVYSHRVPLELSFGSRENRIDSSLPVRCNAPFQLQNPSAARTYVATLCSCNLFGTIGQHADRENRTCEATKHPFLCTGTNTNGHRGQGIRTGNQLRSENARNRERHRDTQTNPGDRAPQHGTELSSALTNNRDPKAGKRRTRQERS